MQESRIAPEYLREGATKVQPTPSVGAPVFLRLVGRAGSAIGRLVGRVIRWIIAADCCVGCNRSLFDPADIELTRCKECQWGEGDPVEQDGSKGGAL